MSRESRDVNEARTLEAEAEARTLEAEAETRTLEAKVEAIARPSSYNFGLRNNTNFEGHSKKFHENLNAD